MVLPSRLVVMNDLIAEGQVAAQSQGGQKMDNLIRYIYTRGDEKPPAGVTTALSPVHEGRFV